ncbi:UDP-N-acetylmuramoyl-L-alanine--D-glutamate ligase, partial [Candidatus Saccharibacteria bacterium]|nr:UDP-N-acetylmuramoyl-L-alanine--D-glutamate ligase [Candidatus Saccharibacteria bacterium]
MKIAIVGWGVEGKSAFKYFGPEHEYLIVNEEPAADFPQQSDNIKLQFLSGKREPGLTGNVADLSYLDGIKSYDKIIFSVTSRPNLEKRFGKDKTFWDKALTVQHIFFEKVKSKNVIGVTGSKGKGTTSTLVAKMLEAAGKKVFLGGNIGISVLDFVNDVKADDWVVLELSNFQLKDFPYSPHIAICLMLVEEHMDWHSDMEDYVEAKSNIFRHQSKSDIAIYFAEDDNSKKIAGYSPGLKIPYYQKPGAHLKDEKIVIGEDDKKIIDKSEIKLLGGHNLQNICAAVTAAWQVTQDIDAIKQVLSSFSGLEHRLEFVRELKGVKYYNDSFGTAPATAIVAM